MKNIALVVVRKFQGSDIDQILTLFYHTVRQINRKDYSPKQVETWAPETPDRTKWLNSLQKNLTYVVEIGKKIIGFEDMDQTGYIDHLYSHADFQGKGVGSAILKKLEEQARQLNLEQLTTESSITAKPFFERHGFVVIRKQNKIYRDIEFINYVMEKKL